MPGAFTVSPSLSARVHAATHAASTPKAKPAKGKPSKGSKAKR